MMNLSEIVLCLICGKEIKQITPAHLKTHQITMADYKSAYPQAEIISEKVRAAIAEGKKGKPRDPAVIAKLHAARDAAPKRSGYKLSKETKQKIANKARGRKLTEEHKANIALGNMGRNHSDDTKQKMRDNYEALPIDKKLMRITKAQDTWVQKYGHAASSDPAVRAKVIATNQARYGGPSPTSSPAIVKKIKETWARNYPETGSPQKDAKVKAKIEARFGHPTSMHLARAAFESQNDGLNPFQVEEIKERIKTFYREKYGSYVTHPKQTHISEEALKTLLSTEELALLIEQYPIKTLGMMLGVWEGTIARRCDDLNIVRYGTSIERAISHVLETGGIEHSMRNRKIISPLELDFVIPEAKIAIEVCGIYWHSSRFLPRSYHKSKLELCRDLGWKLLTIFEDEIIYKLPIVSSRILYMCGQGNNGIGARKLRLSEVDSKTANVFLEKYHIQGGSINNHTNIGAYDCEELVGIMSFKKSWRLSHVEKPVNELSRFATNGKNYAGLASRLFSFYIKNNPVNWIVSYADQRWSDGNLYRQMGFKETIVSQPSYEYVIGKKMERLNKTKFRRSSIEHLVENGDQKSERQIMEELGYSRIYDCGKIRFDWHRSL